MRFALGEARPGLEVHDRCRAECGKISRNDLLDGVLRFNPLADPRVERRVGDRPALPPLSAWRDLHQWKHEPWDHRQRAWFGVGPFPVECCAEFFQCVGPFPEECLRVTGDVIEVHVFEVAAKAGFQRALVNGLRMEAERSSVWGSHEVDRCSHCGHSYQAAIPEVPAHCFWHHVLSSSEESGVPRPRVLRLKPYEMLSQFSGR